MFRRFLSVSGFTLLSRITGFIRDILQAAILGAGPLSDAFFVAFLFPSYFRSLFGEGTINPAFLPRYAALQARGERRAAAGFADAVFSWQMAAQIVILVAALWAMPLVVRVMAPGFDGNPGQVALTAHLSRITFPYLILTVVVVQLSAMLNALEKFAAAAAWSILLNVTMIAALFASAWFPNAAEAAAWGVLAGGFAQLLFIFVAARRAGLTLRLTLPRWTPEIAEFFDRTVEVSQHPQQTQNFVLGDLSRLANESGIAIHRSPVSPQHLGELVGLVEAKTINSKIAKELLARMWAGEGSPKAIVEREGLAQTSDPAALARFVDEVLAANAASVEEYRAGKSNVFGFLVGAVMKNSRGKADPAAVNALLRERLGG